MRKITILLLLSLPFLLSACVPKNNILPQNKTILTYWGLWEGKDIIQPIIDDYQKENPNTIINYQQATHNQYRERLESALAKEGGPDIFRFHNTWTPMLKSYLAPIPPDIFDNKTFEETFYPVVLKDLRGEGQYLGIPLEIDTLALYYNEDLVRQAGITGPPATWKDLEEAALKIRSPKGYGRIDIAGVSLGNTSNVDHWSDIFSLMLLQAGANLYAPVGEEAESALTYYTYFTKMHSVWDDTLDNSTLAFAKGKLGFYFAPSWRYFDIKNINPDLKFSIAPAPQLEGDKTNYATYWVEGVNKLSKNSVEAWKFLKYLSSKSVMRKLYDLESKVRAFGEPPSRVDLASDFDQDPIVSVFLSQAPSAESFYMPSMTHDGEAGLNSRVAKYYEDAINSVLKGNTPSEALSVVSSGLAQILPQYGVPLQ